MTTKVSARQREQYGIWLAQLARAWRAQIDARLAPFGLTQARWLTLYHLGKHGKGLSQKALARHVGVQEPTLVRTLDWLEAEELVERGAMPGDRRSNSIRVTEKAKPVLEQIQLVANRVRAEILAGVTDNEVSFCIEIFERIANNLRENPIVGAKKAKPQASGV